MKYVTMLLLSVALLCSCAASGPGLAKTQKLAESVFQVANELDEQIGTGFLIKKGETYYVFTNKHVCEAYGGLSKYHLNHEPNKFEYSGSIAKVSDNNTDVCAIKLDQKPKEDPLEIVKYKPELFEKLFSLGYPSPTSVLRKIDFEYLEETTEFSKPSFHFDKGSWPGSSGSPIFNEDGKVVSIVWGGLFVQVITFNGVVGIPLGADSLGVLNQDLVNFYSDL